MRCEEKLGAGLPPLGELGLGLALDLQVSPCTVYIKQSGFVVVCLPHSLIAHHLHIDMLASSATSPIFLNRSFLSLFLYIPGLLAFLPTDLAGNPLHPTSTAHI